jgi:Lanthionine synthetase C-like protein
MLLYSIVLPVQTLFSLDPDSKERFLPLISRVMELPPNIERSIRYLWAGEPMSAKAELAQLAVPTAPANLTPFSPSVIPPVDPSVSRNDIEETLAGVARYLLCIADTSRRDRIWPLDSSIYSTNSVSLGYGACGSLLALHTLRAAIPPECLHWLDQYMNREQPLPRGLLTGSSGVAWTLAHVGFGNQAVSLMTQLNTKGAAHDATLCFGLAGEVIANLYIARLERNPVLRDAAISGGDKLLQIAHVDEPGVCWENPDEYAPTVGLVYGGSGIAMALMALFRETHDARFLETAQSALEYELDGAVADGDKLRWNKGPYANVQDPYVLTGASGISTALIAMWQLTRSELHLDLAERAANGSYSRFTVMPGQLEGLSGIGETMLDLYQATGKEEYLHRSWRIAESILCYRIPRQGGYAFPGRLLAKISADFAYGISGIVCFLSRLITGGPRAIFTTELPILERESHASK